MVRHFPNGRTARLRIAWGIALTASLLAVTFTTPGPSLASGNDRHSITRHKAQVGHRLDTSQDNLDEISGRLRTAQGNLDAAATDLSAARSRLADLQVQVQRATAKDARMQAALAEAKQRLRLAKVDLRRGQASVARQRSALAGYAVSSAPSQLSQMSTLGLLFGATSTQQALNRVQANNSAVDAQVSHLQRLQAESVLLRYTEQRVAQATAQVAADRAAAAEQLAAVQDLQSQAVAAEAAVEQRVTDLRGQRDRLASAKQAALDRIASLQKEQDALEARLRRLAERRAAARAAAARAAADKAAQQSSSPSGQSQSSTSSSPTGGGFLSYPVTNTYVTSPYGMRFHPILHIWELHDGTDFHAPCGTPVYAAADGRVMSEYFNTGYGNRLLIDHGTVNGVSLQTSYNHLTSYVAGVGQQVSRGQLIAYSGTTGWSTACHLHFMVYVNGSTVNPLTWL